MRPQRLVVLVAVACLAVGALGGVAAANGVTEDTTIGTNESVTVGDDGGYLDVNCIGTVTDHDCDKEGELDAGPASVDYDGFNNDSLADRRSTFGDHFVITVDDKGAVVGFTCAIDTNPSAENPCPVTAEQYEDEGNNGQGDERSEAKGNNGEGGNNGQGDDNASDRSNQS
jgi:hypothetical protein